MEEKEKKIVHEKTQELFLGIKLQKLVPKVKAGVCTPPPSWNFYPTFQHQDNNKNDGGKCYNNVSGENECNVSSLVSARQLGANLWEFLPYMKSVGDMSYYYKGGFKKSKNLQCHTVVEEVSDGASDEQFKSVGHMSYYYKGGLKKCKESLNLKCYAGVEGPLDGASDEQARSSGSRIVDRSDDKIQPGSPASYSSSMEVTTNEPAATPSSSQNFRGAMGNPSHSLKTSRELLKILNRIWYLEEQHASKVSLLKALKSELGNARTRIKDLLREKQKDRQIIGDLMKQVAEHKVVKRNMEQDRVQSALQSVRHELEDERKLRKRSESLRRKMAREISEMKSSFSKALNELERERRARILLEDLCDEFAMGVRNYEQELRSPKYRSEKEQIHRGHVDSLVLHISEAWLDERVQMKLPEEMRKDMGENGMIVDKLRPELETFLKARQTLDSKEDAVDLHNKSSKGNGIHHQSLESFPLNEATSAPKIADDEDDNDSVDSDSICFELTKNIGGEYSNVCCTKNVNASEERRLEEAVNTAIAKRKVEGQDLSHGHSLSSLQARFEKHMARMTLGNGYAQDKARFGNRGGNLNHMHDNLSRNNSSSTEGARIHPESELPDVHALLTGSTSPVKNWESKISSQDHEISESSSNCPRGCKESTLKARLLVARLEGRNIQSKSPKGDS